MILRPAEKSDWLYILDTRNEFYEMYRNQTPLGWEKHKEYLTMMSGRSDFQIWIIIHKEERVGFVKLNGTDLAIVVEKRHHGKGYGEMALRLGIKYCKIRGLKTLTAAIRPENQKSLNLYRKLGYKNEIITMELDLAKN